MGRVLPVLPVLSILIVLLILAVLIVIRLRSSARPGNRQTAVRRNKPPLTALTGGIRRTLRSLDLGQKRVYGVSRCVDPWDSARHE